MDDDLLAEALLAVEDAREIVEWAAMLRRVGDPEHPIILAAREWLVTYAAEDDPRG